MWLCDRGEGVGGVELEVREDHLVLRVSSVDVVIMGVQVRTNKSGQVSSASQLGRMVRSRQCFPSAIPLASSLYR